MDFCTLKNNSLRPITVGTVTILPGQTSDEVPAECLEHSGVKALMKVRELTEDGGESAPKPAPKPAAAPPPPAEKK